MNQSASILQLRDRDIFEGRTERLLPAASQLQLSYLCDDTGEYTQLYRQTVQTNTGWLTIYHSPAELMEATVSDSGVTVQQEHYAYMSRILLTSSTDQEVTLTISGYLLRDDPITETKQLHPNGEICTFQNDLAGINPAQALDWFGEYCNMREELTLPARGRPEWDCGDFIRLESGDAAQIIKSELTFNGAFRETFTVRRGSRYGVGDAQNELGNPL